MPRTKWKLTQAAIDAGPQIDEYGDGRLIVGEKPFSLLHELAKDPANQLEEVHPGVFRGPKAP